MPLETDFVPISLPSHDGSLDAVALGLVSSKAEGGGLAERLASEADAIRSSEEEAQRLHTFEKERGRRGRKLQFTNAFTGYAWNEEQLDVLAIPRHERTEPQIVLLIPDWQRKLVLQTDLAREGAVARIQEQPKIWRSRGFIQRLTFGRAIMCHWCHSFSWPCVAVRRMPTMFLFHSRGSRLSFMATCD